MNDTIRKMIRKTSKSPVLKLIPDKLYIQLIYYYHFHRFVNFKNPITFSEKLQWMKIYDRKPIYSDMVDKYKAKLFVSKIIGEEYVVPTFGAWNSFEEIDFNSLPNRFVLKTNHDSGGMVICRNKKNFDYNNAKKILNAHLKRNGFWYGREWPYKNVKPLIIAEQLLENGGQFEKGTCLNVYKFFTFNGEPLIIQTIQNDKQPNETIDYFDCNWNLLRLKQSFPNSDNPLPKPRSLPTMISLVRELAKGFKHIRVDLYDVNGKVYFSEFTFYSDSGFTRFDPPEWDEKLGDLIKLEN